MALSLTMIPLRAAGSGAETWTKMQTSWTAPARTYRPHTRWWWPGNVLTEADITWQLEQMKAQGIGGVEICSTWRMYQKDNPQYFSPEFRRRLQYAVTAAKRLDLDVAVTLGAGWLFGGDWVPAEDQSRILGMTSVEMTGGARFSGALPVFNLPDDNRNTQTAHHPVDHGRLVAVVAMREDAGGQLVAESSVVLTTQEQGGETRLDWTAPAGRWRVMAFWLARTWQINYAQSFDPDPMVIDHLNRGAVTRYLEHVGGLIDQAVGADFGTTVDSLFCDSFETAAPEGTLLWSGDTLAAFQRKMGYDLTKDLPAIWFNIGPVTPRVRYDVGKFLSDLALENFFAPYNAWCAAHHVEARIQPHYRFTEELVQGAGATQRPETETTTARFEPLAEPRKAEASGARFYGRDILSAEAYTFLHMTRYRSTLEEVKIATDAFLRDGVTQFYNAGYFGSPEPHVAPGRDMPFDTNQLNHWSPLWPHYHYLAEYVARSCAMLRPGKLVADVLVYTPQATAWSQKALWTEEIRALPYGNLAKTLVANGYDFDVVNDDLMQRHATFHDGGVELNGHLRRVLILPNTSVVPIETMRAIQRFARAGGQVIALEHLPTTAAGLLGAERNDAELQQIVRDVFADHPAAGRRATFLPEYLIRSPKFSPAPKPYSVTAPLQPVQRQLLAAIAETAQPDLTLPGGMQSDGLTFIHKRLDAGDVYFVTNLEPKAFRAPVTFRSRSPAIQQWNPRTGERSSAVGETTAQGTVIPVRLEAWESTFYVFPDAAEPATSVAAAIATGTDESPRQVIPMVGPWKLNLTGQGAESAAPRSAELGSWTDQDQTRHFSGTGRYETEFDCPRDSFGRVVLDLGRVGTVAEVELNGRSVGVAWMEPYRLDVTAAVQPGPNRLVIMVSNTLINYVAGLKGSPEIPDALQARLGRQDTMVYPGGRLHPFPDSWLTMTYAERDLPASGLLGPVQLLCFPMVR